jgi:hypothetical protein
VKEECHKYIEVPVNCISRYLEICPTCNDTKNVKLDGTVTLAYPPDYMARCYDCNVCWTISGVHTKRSKDDEIFGIL